MAACGNSDQEVSQSQTGGSESRATGSSEAAGGSETAGSSEASAPADDFTYPMEPVTFTFNGSGSGGTEDAIGKNWGNVDDYCQEMILKYIVGSSDISEWDSLVNTIKGMEIDKVLAAKQEAYDDYLQRVEELKK